APKVATADPGRTQPATPEARPTTNAKESSMVEPVAPSAPVQEPPHAPVADTDSTAKVAAVAAPTETLASTRPITLTERRVALVIGNGKYVSQGHLDNPRNDAEAVSAALREIGFQAVTTLH